MKLHRNAKLSVIGREFAIHAGDGTLDRAHDSLRLQDRVVRRGNLGGRRLGFTQQLV